MIAGVRVDQHRLAARADPLDRPPHALRGPQDQHMLGESGDAHAKSATHIRRDHAQTVFRDVHDLGDQGMHLMHALTWRMERVASLLHVEISKRCDRLHREADDAVTLELDIHHMSGFRERALDRGRISDIPVDGDIARRVVPQQRCAVRRGVAHGDDAREGFVGDIHQLGRVARSVFAFGDHDGDGLARKAHTILCQDGARRRKGFAAVTVFETVVGLQTLEPVRFDVLAGQHGQHARNLPRGGRIDGGDLRMGVGRPQDGEIRLTGRAHILDEAAAAGEKTRILAAQNRLAETEPH